MLRLLLILVVVFVAPIVVLLMAISAIINHVVRPLLLLIDRAFTGRGPS